MIGSYNNDLEEGVWQNYWENGQLKNSSEFKKGKLHGNWTSFNPYGNIKVIGKYKNGFEKGKWITLFSNGQYKEVKNMKIIKKKSKANDVVLKGRVHQMSVKHGKYEAYSARDYQLVEKGVYKNGKKHGTWFAYHPGGRIPSVITNYKNGKLNGVYQTFTRRGKLIQKGNYSKGVRHGKMIFLDAQGKIVSEKLFKYGKEIKTFQTFRP